jgi:hypothetical protein
MSRMHRWLFPVAAALALAAPVSAQWKPSADAGQVRTFSMAALNTSVPETGMMGGLETAAHETLAPAFTAPPLPGVRRTSRDVALMIVGGAALILGSVIGDDAGAMLAVGGGVVGLVGLYQYLT